MLISQTTTTIAKHRHSMQPPRDHRDPRSRSVSKSPLPSPGEERSDPLHRTVAFVPFQGGTTSGVSNETRRAVRVQAAKASAAARKRTIARKLAEKQSSSSGQDEAVSPSAASSDQSRRTSSTSAAESDYSVQFAASRSPSRSLTSTPVSSTAGNYPVRHWHHQIPQLVDYFTRLFLPDPASSQDMTDGRDDMRTQLWPAAMRDTCLFNAILLLSASHATVTRSLAIPTSLLSQLKSTTIETINDAIAKSESSTIGDAAVGAIALLGAWELEYGTASAYDTHMGGLAAIVNNMHGGLTGANATLSPFIRNLVLAVGHDQALYSSKRPYFETFAEQSAAATLPSTLPAGFEELRAQRLLIPSLMHLLGRLNTISPQDAPSLGRLSEVQDALGRWSPQSAHAASYSPIRTTLEDILVRQTSLHLRIAGLAISYFLKYAFTADAHQMLEGLYNESCLLHADLIIGTTFEEVTLWCIVMICSTTGRCEPQHMRTLKRLCLELGISHWEDLRSLLGRYVYHASLLESRVYVLWEAVRSSTIARDSGIREMTRFAKGIQHPLTYVGEAIAAEG